MFWILLGVLLALVVRNGSDTQGMAKDVRSIIRVLRKVIKDIGRTVRHALKESRKGTGITQKADPEQETAAENECAAQPEQPETRECKALLKDMEERANLAAILADVPTIDFPADDPKYESSRKYTYA